MGKKVRKYPTDTEVGIRTITQIDNLPSKELTDEEFVKQFFKRFDATAMIIAYVDDSGQLQTFGRLRSSARSTYWYRRILDYLRDQIGIYLRMEE
jgi:hypothetical protein